jgi:putative tryptophan/tyrosine transport system substrate-binding protein
MKRRAFITLLGGMMAIRSLAARAQQVAKPVVGFLHSGSKLRSPHVIGFFRQGLNEAGFAEGSNVTVQYRFAEGKYDQLPAMVAEFVNGNVAVLAATGGVQTALAAKAANTSIPVVFANGSDPVQFGLVESLNRPGGNMTGVSFFTATLEAKRLGLLSELVPAARTFGILINPKNDNAENQMKDIAQGALILSRPIIILKASNEQEIETTFEKFGQQGVDALLVGSDPFFYGQRQQIVALAARYHLPAIYEWREFAEAGGLASYGTNLLDNYRLAGISVGRILKGEKPADLPVVQATKFEFIINLKTAKSLGLKLPSGPLSTADEVIE